MINVTEKEFQSLVNDYYEGKLEISFKELMDNYNIVLEKDPNHNNDAINDLINKFCTNIQEKENSTTYKGLSPNNYLNFDRHLTNDFKPMHGAFNGYREVYYSQSDLCSVETVEGDIYITLFDNIEAYNSDYEKSLEFYEEN